MNILYSEKNQRFINNFCYYDVMNLSNIIWALLIIGISSSWTKAVLLYKMPLFPKVVKKNCSFFRRHTPNVLFFIYYISEASVCSFSCVSNEFNSEKSNSLLLSRLFLLLFLYLQIEHNNRLKQVKNNQPYVSNLIKNPVLSQSIHFNLRYWS